MPKLKIDSMPPYMPILVEDWQGSSTTQHMTDTQVGIAIKAMLKQWQNGSIPRSAWDLSRDIKSSYNTTLKFLRTYSKFFVCVKCGESWSEATCKCGCTDAEGRLHNTKLKKLRNYAKTGVELETIETNRNENKVRESNNHNDEKKSVILAKPSNQVLSVLPESEPETFETSDDGTSVASDPRPYVALATKLFLGIGEPKSYADPEHAKAWTRALETGTGNRTPVYLNTIMDWVLASDFWYPKIRKSRKLSPCEYFIAKLLTFEEQMEGEAEDRKRAKKPAGKEVVKSTYKATTTEIE